MSTTWPERTERERTEAVDGRFLVRDHARHTHHRTNRESHAHRRTPNSPQNLRIYATPAALATGVSVSSWLGRLAPLIGQCTNHALFLGMVVVRVIRLWDED